ncbi:MAG: hypothetical protein OQK04_02685 [Kangiellaceae bacterium]|nr:hypothetical protein [Kangiellaceae bacterium]MCW8997611.1 hypothetical protein [Kangiellaceae bacterium]
MENQLANNKDKLLKRFFEVALICVSLFLYALTFMDEKSQVDKKTSGELIQQSFSTTGELQFFASNALRSFPLCQKSQANPVNFCQSYRCGHL